MDLRIPEMLGMSRAIIENVILCHQDESNWPLSDVALLAEDDDQSHELKKRFDSIFESTYYTKSLEAIQKERKEKVVLFTRNHHKKDELIQCEKDEIDKRNKFVQAGKIRAEMQQLSILSVASISRYRNPGKSRAVEATEGDSVVPRREESTT